MAWIRNLAQPASRDVNAMSSGDARGRAPTQNISGGAVRSVRQPFVEAIKRLK